MIERHFGDFKGVIAIHDNLIISVVSLSKHDKILRNKSERAKDRNVRFVIKKIQLRVPEVKYLRNITQKKD